MLDVGKKSLQFILDNLDKRRKIDKLIDKWFINNFNISGERYSIRDTRMVYYGRDLVEFFNYNFGDQPKNKNISNDVMNYPLEFQKGLLRGWLLGDSGTWKDERNRIKITGSTVSNQLADNIYILSLRLGLRPSLKKKKI